MQNPFAKGVTPQVREHIRRGLRLKDLVPAEAVREAWADYMRQHDFVAAYN